MERKLNKLLFLAFILSFSLYSCCKAPDSFSPGDKVRANPGCAWGKSYTLWAEMVHAYEHDNTKLIEQYQNPKIRSILRFLMFLFP